MTNKTVVRRLVYAALTLLVLAVLVFLALTPDIYLQSHPVYGAF